MPTLAEFRDKAAPLACPHCGAELEFTHRHDAEFFWICFALAWLLPYAAGLRGPNLPYLSLVWLPLLLVLVRTGLPLTVPMNPPEWRLRRSSDALLFFGWWLILGVFNLVYSLHVIVGTAIVLGSPRDVSEALDFPSIPLGWASSAFVIRPNMDFLRVAGIVFFNAFFYTAVLFPIAKIVRGFIRRSRVTQLGISSTVGAADKEDEL